MKTLTVLVCLSLSSFALNAHAGEMGMGQSTDAGYNYTVGSTPSGGGQQVGAVTREMATFGSKHPGFGGAKQAFQGNPQKSGDTRSRAQKNAEFQASRAAKRQIFQARTAQWRAGRAVRSLPGVSQGLNAANTAGYYSSRY